MHSVTMPALSPGTRLGFSLAPTCAGCERGRVKKNKKLNSFKSIACEVN